jgi:hypothetical protein
VAAVVLVFPREQNGGLHEHQLVTPSTLFAMPTKVTLVLLWIEAY